MHDDVISFVKARSFYVCIHLSSAASSRQRFIKQHEAPSWRFPTLFEAAWTARASATAPEAEAEADKRSFSCFAASSGSTSFAFDVHEVQGLQEHQEFSRPRSRSFKPKSVGGFFVMFLLPSV